MIKHSEELKQEAVRIALTSDLPGDADQYPWLSLMAVTDDQPTCADGHEGAGPYPGTIQPDANLH